jgi:hypothetical protein
MAGNCWLNLLADPAKADLISQYVRISEYSCDFSTHTDVPFSSLSHVSFDIDFITFVKTKWQN